MLVVIESKLFIIVREATAQSITYHDISGEASGWIQLVTGYVKVICWILRVVGGGPNGVGLCIW